mgnify:CR=1 FL=1
MLFTTTNSELIPNVNLCSGKNVSVAALLDSNDKEPVYKKYDSQVTGGLANLLLSKGKACVVNQSLY